MRKKTEKFILCVLILSFLAGLGGCSVRPRAARTENGERLFRMGFSGASVCRAMRLIQDGGYLYQNKSKHLLLTETGEALARMLCARHATLVSCLRTVGVSESAAAEDACRLEHYLSDETFRAIGRLLDELTAGASLPGENIPAVSAQQAPPREA